MSFWNRLFGKKDKPTTLPPLTIAGKLPPPLPKLPPLLPHPTPAVTGDATHLPATPVATSVPLDTSRSIAAPVDQLARRQIRVFISSTFKDMQEERELLVKKVFPELRRICDERFVSFTEVDLRWGITEEAAAEGKVLPICLEEIHNCRPYFIGMLGERYGWVPDTVPPEVLNDEPWIQEHEGSTSVTELEILHGVLNNPEMDGHSFFYFRDPAYSASRGADFLTENPDSAAKLATLKETIRQSGRPLVDPYADPEELAAAIRQQFLDLIDQLYPKEEVPDPLDQEADGHRTYARRKLLAYVDRPTHSQAIADFVAASHDYQQSTPNYQLNQGLVITGDSGGGKTALLAAYATSSFSTHPSTFLFEHYFGATSASASVPGFLHRLLGELKRRADIPDEIPSDPEKMIEALPLWLAQTVGKIPRIVLVLDALNQIEGEPAQRNLSWLPRFFPQHVRVIASSLTGPALDTLSARGWATHPLPLANEEERGRMLDTFFELYKKTLDPALRSQIIQAPGAANPLFLRTVLEELRQFGSFSKLPDQVAEYLTATTPVELFRQVIRRWQTDFHGGRDVVDRSLRHLWAARQGLGESEWLDLLADGRGVMDRQTWRPLFLALATHLVQRSGLWALGHDYLRQAIESELLPAAEEKKQAHLALADYFERHEVQKKMTPRKAAEWPFQLHAAEAWDRLEACLTNIPLFLALYNDRTKWELTGYWLPLRQAHGRDMGVCYTSAFQNWSAHPDHTVDHYVPAEVGAFLLENGLYPPAEPLLRRALEASERVLGAEHSFTLESVNNLAALFYSKGDYGAAQPLVERALEARERVLGAEHPNTLASVSGLAALLASKGDYAGAQPLYERALEASERVLGAGHPDTLGSVNNLAGLLYSQGDYAGAQPLFERALEARERVLGAEHPDTLVSANNLAALLESKGDYAGAQPLYERALEARERVLGEEHPNTLGSLNNLGFLLYSKGDYAGAQPLFERALEASERVLGAEHPDTLGSVNNLALLLESQADYAGAQPLFERALEASERIRGEEHPNTLLSVNNLASLLESQGDYGGAQPLYERALEASERVLGEEHPNTLLSVNNLAGLLESKGDYAGAQPLYERALEARERGLGAEHPDTLGSVNDLAYLLYSKGDYAGAQPLFERALDASERVLGAEHPDTLGSVNGLAGLLYSKGDYARAQTLFERALEARERVLGAEHPDTLVSVNNLAELLRSKGDYAGAQPLYERALEASERVLGAEHPDTLVSLNNLGLLLSSQGDYAGAQPLYGRALEASERVLGAEHPNTLLSVNNLALLLYSQGDYAGAQPLFERALEASERVLGAEHPDTLGSVNNLAALLESHSDYAGAKPLYERALEASERVLGAEHPQTLASANNLAALLESQGDYSGAQPLYERALEGLLKMSQSNQCLHPNLEASV